MTRVLIKGRRGVDTHAQNCDLFGTTTSVYGPFLIDRINDSVAGNK